MTERQEKIQIEEDIQEAKLHAEKLIAGMRERLVERRDRLQKRLEESMNEYRDLDRIIKGLYLNADNICRAAEHFKNQTEVEKAQVEVDHVYRIYDRIDNLEFERNDTRGKIEEISKEISELHLGLVSPED